MYGEHATASTAAYQALPTEGRYAIDTVADRMRNQAVPTGTDYGVAKYGAILYQLARKFFPGARAEPDLAELIKAGNDVPGWRTGYMQGTGSLSNMHLDMPHTYLGGMPFICSGSTSLDPAQRGNRSGRRGFVVEPVQSPRDPHPGQSDMAALIYLGWATHMIQDASVPHHAAGWAGKEHGKQDALGDFFGYFRGPECDEFNQYCVPPGPPSLDATSTAEVDAVLGPERTPRAAAISAVPPGSSIHRCSPDGWTGRPCIRCSWTP